MGVVYRGEHIYLGREVAIKILRVGSIRRAQAIKWFLREARAASRISHPGIVAVTDFDKCADGTVFMVMELVRGEALDFLIEREQRLSPARAINLALQISDAIAAVHRAGIIHRDLKPANIMVTTRAEGPQSLREPPATIFESIEVLDFRVAKPPGEPPPVPRGSYPHGTPPREFPACPSPGCACNWVRRQLPIARTARARVRRLAGVASASTRAARTGSQRRGARAERSAQGGPRPWPRS